LAVFPQNRRLVKFMGFGEFPVVFPEQPQITLHLTKTHNQCIMLFSEVNTMKKPNGFILYETDTIVHIVTGINNRSDNPKTGDMLQIWHILKSEHPVEALRNGHDKIVCDDCPFASGNGCYVNIMGVAQVYRAYRNGNYPLTTDYSFASGRKIRFGAYGNPSHLPIDIVRQLCNISSGWTGYVHNYRTINPEYAQFFMASTHDMNDIIDAKTLGYRCFTVGTEYGILCPASEEAGKRTTCAKCNLCDGARMNDVRKDIFIAPHGTKKKLALQVIS
jgi:hypothetical protein